MALITTQHYDSPVGELILGTFDDKLCLCNWRDKKNKTAIERRLFKHFKATLIEGKSTTLDNAVKQLDGYFNGEITQFDIPLLTAGTDFQRQVWDTLQTIEYGQTISYLELARKLKKPSAVRAVANANAANALSIIIPCHRIIGNNGKLVGYAGGIETKQRLLKLEHNNPFLS